MLSWLLTYWFHSSLLIGTAALVSRLLSDRQLPLKEALWRLALVGGLVTSTLQITLPMEPLGGIWEVNSSSSVTTEDAAISAPFSPPAHGTDRPLSGSFPQRMHPNYQKVSRWIDTIWACGAILLTSILLLAHLRLERQLRPRQIIKAGSIRRILDDLLQGSRLGQPVNLTSAATIAVPLAKGWIHHEICLPQRAIRQLSAAQKENVLAHELAHLERRDPLWFLILHLLESVFFFQPLNKLGRRRLQEIAEYRCDDWAVTHTGRPLTMARCLASVAEWNVDRDQPTLAPALASSGRSLKRRVIRLLDRSYPLPASRRPKWWLPLAILFMALIVVGVPGFSAAQPDAPPPPLAPVAEDPPNEPAPPAPVQPIETPAAAAQPLNTEPPPVPIPPTPAQSVKPVSPIQPRELEFHELRELLQMEQLAVEERVEAQTRSLERIMAVELDRLERFPVERIEALEQEIRAVTELHQEQMEKMMDLKRDLHARVQREQSLRRDELLELREELLRRREEFHERYRERDREESSREEPPS